MKDRRFIWRRIVAYTIDILLVTMLVSMLSNIKMINPRVDKYKKEYENYAKIVERYQKKKITKKTYQKQYNNIYYIMQKDSIYYNIIYLAIIVLYFGIFQYITHGQTVGKKLMKMKLVTDKEKDISIFKTIIRSIFLYSTIYYILLSIGLLLASGIYPIYAQIIYYLNTALELVIIYLVFSREDNRGLHDLIAGTKVISLEEPKEENIVIDAKIEEKEKPKKSRKTTPKTTKKASKSKKTKKIDE